MTKTCRICKQSKPSTEFGFNRRFLETGACDGLDIYCLVCVRKKVKENRTRRQAMMSLPPRKPSVILPTVLKPIYHSPIRKVKYAVARGYRTREAIRAETRLPWEDICEALAELSLVQGVIFSKRVNGEAFFYEKRAA